MRGQMKGLKSSLPLQKSCDINIPNMLILLNILRYGRMKNIIETLSYIKYSGKDQTRLNIEKQLKQLNKYFLTIRFKKLY